MAVDRPPGFVDGDRPVSIAFGGFRVQIRVLGELEVVGPAGPVALRALKLRQLLAALVVAGGEPRSADSLLDALWGESPPPSAGKLLQVYVSRLRKLLPDGIGIRTQGAGYALELSQMSLDAAQFERLVNDGRKALRDGNPLLAGSLLRRAMSLWHGRPYGELADFEFARFEAARLEELRLVALEERIEADLAAGRHAGLIAELGSLARAHPLRERLQAQAMLCLYRCGRHTEALELFSALRATLNDELGLEPGSTLRELQARILRHDPALLPRVEPDAPGGLPTPANRLVGRERELRELGELMRDDDVRLVVLTGAGGSGKTRLAVEAARQSERWFANGAAFVSLAPLREPTRVVGEIVRAVGLEERPGEDLKRLAKVLSTLELMLVVDNVEHLRSATPMFVELLAGAPRLKLLVTSRAVLHLSGEHVYPVRSLADDDAFELFVERARATEPTFGPAGAQAQVVARICERLDKLPLAIELAASRMRMLSPHELLARLEPRLPLLTGGVRDLPARQQTMQATIAWSHDLLDQPAQRAFRRLAIFAGGCTLEAAEAICESDLERLTALVEDNLLHRSTTAGGSRYVMLETVREYASQQLREAGELQYTSDRHLRFFLELAERCNLHAEAERPQDFETANAEQENFRAAIEWGRRSGQIATALQLVVALENFWVTHDPREGVQLITELLHTAGHLRSALQARALRAFGGFTQVLGELEQADHLYQKSRNILAAIGDKKGTAILDYRRGLVALDRRDVDHPAPLLEHSLDAFRAIGSKRGEAQATGALGSLAREQGERQLAAHLFQQSAAMCEQIGRQWWQAMMLAELAELALEDGRISDATARSTQLLKLASRIGDRQRTLLALAYLACAAARTQQLQRAGRLWAALEAERARRPGTILLARYEPHPDTVLADPTPLLEQGLQEGKHLSLQQAVAHALGRE
ncbi:MAG: BTAD domain-containing putative transcriptional regulator [Actinomycetota bacterium]